MALIFRSGNCGSAGAVATTWVVVTEGGGVVTTFEAEREGSLSDPEIVSAMAEASVFWLLMLSAKVFARFKGAVAAFATLCVVAGCVFWAASSFAFPFHQKKVPATRTSTIKTKMLNN